MKKTTKKLKKIIEKTAPDFSQSIVADAIASLPYTATIKVFGKYYSASGASVKEAIESLKVGKVGGVCVMTVTHGENKKEKILNAGQLFRLFTGSRIIHEMAIKNVINIFGDL